MSMPYLAGRTKAFRSTQRTTSGSDQDSCSECRSPIYCQTPAIHSEVQIIFAPSINDLLAEHRGLWVRVSWSAPHAHAHRQSYTPYHRLARSRFCYGRPESEWARAACTREFVSERRARTLSFPGAVKQDRLWCQSDTLGASTITRTQLYVVNQARCILHTFATPSSLTEARRSRNPSEYQDTAFTSATPCMFSNLSMRSHRGETLSLTFSSFYIE